MISTYRTVKRRRASSGVDGGFTLIELLIVIVVLGILAGIVVFALGGVTGKSAVAACQSDAKTVGVAVSAMQAENPSLATPATGGPTVAGSWQSDLLGTSTATAGITGGPFLQSWPANSGYTITVAPSGATATTAANGMGSVTPNAGDVIVTIGSSNYDATQFPTLACTGA